MIFRKSAGQNRAGLGRGRRRGRRRRRKGNLRTLGPRGLGAIKILYHTFIQL